MLSAIQKLFAPPVFEDAQNSRAAALLNSVLWTFIILGGLYAVTAPTLLGQTVPAAATGLIVISSLIARQFMLKGHVQASAIIFLVVFHVLLTVIVIFANGVFSAGYYSYILVVVIAGILLGGRGAYMAAGVSALTGLVIMLFQNSLPQPLTTPNPLTNWVILLAYLLFIASLQNASAGGLDKLLKNLRATQKNLVERNTELQKFSVTLEESVAKRTAELDAANRSNERRARQFEAITQISRVLNQTQNLENLLLQTTEVISRLFTFYHVGVFLLDDNNEFAVLVAANSEGGQKMLARNHKLRVGQTGIVGYVSGSALPRIALDTGSDAIYFDNPDLPETRSEMALPLLHAEKHVIGVLDVQSREPDAFGQEDLQTLAILADQVAVAIDNARLFEELQKTLQESEVFYRRGLKSGWAKFAQAQKLAGVHRSGLKTSFLEKPVELPGAFEAARTGSVYRNIDDQTKSSQLTLPMKLRDEVVGVLNIRANDNREWNDDDMDIINAIVERAALSIENARLLAESRKIAEREQVIGEISTKISAGTEIEAILRTAVRELGTQIRGAQVTVEIGGGEE